MAHESVQRQREQGDVMTPAMRDFFNWYVDPDRDGTIIGYARDHGHASSTVHGWKRDPRFKRELEEHYARLNISPDRVQEVVDAMFAAAKGGDTRAATLYLQYIDRLAPKKVVIEDKRVEAMTDDELDAEWAALNA